VKLNPSGEAHDINQLFWKDVFMVIEAMWKHIFALKNGQSLLSLHLNLLLKDFTLHPLFGGD